SVGQTRYAAQDVIHLPQLYDILTKLLLKSERLYFFEEEMRYLIKLSYQENQKLKYYQKVKGIWKLNSLELDRLFNLCLWRETQAEISDIPRARVIDDKVLFMLSVKNPKSIDDLSNLGFIQGNKIKKYGFAILDAVKKDQAVTLDPPNKPLNREQRKLFKSIKTEIMSLAESINMSPSFLCNKKEIETIVRKIESSDNEYEKIFRASWRYTLLKDLIERYKLNYQANH
ncbi:MAG: HRDC domain-containing protein, partial [Pseudomonadota bacterium]|nr:HRDC domain-containing protein [Pseudomonadota bacterium]